jgi:ABC-2 type transport system ATP-binding protein
MNQHDNHNHKNAAIWTHDLTRHFSDEVAVNDVSLVVPHGKIFGFIGPSGSGKTTMLRLLTGIYQPSAGEVKVLGVPPSAFNTRLRQRIGYMPQLFVLYPNLTVWENLNFAASLYGMGLRRSRRLKEVLDFVELTEHRHKLARNISGGMQRRLSLAATLIHKPEILFLDEPTAGIDPILRRKFWDRFRQLQEEGTTFFITTQYVSEAAYCDLVGVLASGRLLAVDTPEGLRHRAYGGDLIDLRTEEGLRLAHRSALRQLPFVTGPVTAMSDTDIRLTVADAGSDIPSLLEWCRAQDIKVVSVEEYIPPYDDVFVEIVREEPISA